MKQLYTTLIAVLAIVQFSYANYLLDGKYIYNSSDVVSTKNLNVFASSVSSSFTPTTAGWYRITTLGNPQGGTVRISGYYANNLTDIEFQYDIGGYGTGGSIQQTRFSSYNNGFVDQVRISSDGAANTYLDIHINIDNTVSPGLVYLSGDGPYMSSFITNPTVGATAGSTNVNILTLSHGFNTTYGSTFAQNGGSVGIGTIDTKGYKLAVNGSAIATSVTVKLYGNWPDFVFKKEYKLPSLLEVKNYIDANHHLPDVPSEQEVKDSGLNLGEIVRIQTKKIEELTLYAIQQKEENQKLKVEQLNTLQAQQQQIDELKAQVAKLIKQ